MTRIIEPWPDGQAPRRHYLGLDLGQTNDPTALAVVEQALPWQGGACVGQAVYCVRFLRRYPLGTRYPAIVKDVAGVTRSKELLDPMLVVDETGVGAAVSDLLDEADVRGPIRRVWITAGHHVKHEVEGTPPRATWNVPKKMLVGVLQVLLQDQRLTIARLPEREMLQKELLNFRVKISAAMNELFAAWREGQSDDLVLAVALACWAAEGTAPYTGELPERAPLRSHHTPSAVECRARGWRWD